VCALCKKLPKIVEEAGAAEAMSEIEAAIVDGTPAEHFKGALDKILGTEEPDQDEFMDSVWESSHRRQS
jgi:hypothetical protein